MNSRLLHHILPRLRNIGTALPVHSDCSDLFADKSNFSLVFHRQTCFPVWHIRHVQNMADVRRVGLYVAVPVVDAEVSVHEAIALTAAQVCGGVHNRLRGQLERVTELQRLVRRPGRQRELVVEQLRRAPLCSQRGAAEWMRYVALSNAPVRYVQRRAPSKRLRLNCPR